jgi:hypothetical protein
MAGLKFLYNLILKDIVKGSGQASGILSIGSDVRKIAMNKYAKFVDSAKRQGVDLDKLSEQEIKYMLELNKPKGPTIGGHQIIDASSPEGQGITRDLFNMLDRQSGKNVIKADFGKPFAEETGSVDNIIKNIKTMKPIESMKETNKVLKGEGKYKNLSKADREKIAGDESVTDHIFERNIEPDPEDFAYGGVAGMLGERTGYNEGKTAKKSFIKLIPQFTEKGEQIPVFSKTGKQQIEGAPEGITSDKEVFNLIVGLDIPINDKINILGDIGFSKFRDKIEKGDEELFLADPAGNINKNIGIGYEDDGLSGSIMYNPDTKYKQFQISKKFADGGIARQNFAMGRRAFMKLLGGAAAGIGALKTGAFKLLGKEAAPVAKEVVKSVGSGTTPPPYFFNLVNKIKNLGDDVTPKYATQERQRVTKYKDFELTEDIVTGEKTIQKKSFADIDEGFSSGNKTEEVYMNYKPGKSKMDETTKGKTPPDEYTEDTTTIGASGGQRGEIIDTVDGVPDEVIQEGTMFEDNITEFGKKITKTKKASGGLAHMVGE